MNVTTEMFYPGAHLDHVVAMVFDEGFRAAVCEATKAISHQVDTSLGDDGSAVVTVRRTLPTEVPEFVKKFVGDTIELVQSETWAADDGSGVRRADLTLEVIGQPATMTGSIVLEERADGVHEVVHGELRVAVPFFGGKIEAEIAKGIVAAARAEENTGTRVARGLTLSRELRETGRLRAARASQFPAIRGVGGRGSHPRGQGTGTMADMDHGVDMLLLKGVARPCPDCAEERLFVPADVERGELGEYCCTWCGAGLLIDPSATHPAAARHVA